MIYEILLEGCDDFYIKKTARHFGVRFVEHVCGGLKCSGYTLDITTSSIFVREDEMCKRRVKRPSTHFVGLQYYTEMLGYEPPVIYRDVFLRD